MTDWNEQMRRRAEEDARNGRGFDHVAARQLPGPLRELAEKAYNDQKNKNS